MIDCNINATRAYLLNSNNELGERENNLPYMKGRSIKKRNVDFSNLFKTIT